MGKHGGANKERSFARVLKQAAERSKIRKTITGYALRHSLAIHLLESSTNLGYIQELPGHGQSEKDHDLYSC